MDRRVPLVAAVLMAVLFAGCVDSEDPEDPTSGTDPDGEPQDPMDEGLTADSVVEAPQWNVGDYFGHHIFFGSEDAQGTHIDTVVVDAGSSYTLVSDQEEAAKWEAAWDFPMLGTIGSTDLETTAFGADWNLYDFPLQDGKSWTATFNPLFNGPRELTLTATFDPAIGTVGQGIKEGFRIEGVNADGAVELITDYIPEIGWYSELTYVDRTVNADATDDDFVIRVWAMGQGESWEGTTITAEAIELVNFNACFAPLNPDGSVNDQCTTAGGVAAPEVSEDADQLYGAYFLLAIAGHSRIDLVEFSDTPFSHDRSVQSNGLEDVALEFSFYEIDDPTPGEWQFTWQGEGFVTVGYAQLWEIQYTATPFPTA